MRDTRKHVDAKWKLAVAAAAAAFAVAALVGASAWADAADEPADDAAAESTVAASSDQLAAVSGYPTEGRFVDGITALPEFYEKSEKNARTAEENAPERTVDRNGFTIQRTPADGETYNTTYLDADNRGCNSCHTLENALMSLPTYHRLIFFGYNTEQTYENCVACHSDSYSGRSLADPLHTLHMNSSVFASSGGTCQSCHYINPATNSFELWDEVKYDVLKGFTGVDAETAGISVSYDQTTITPAENRYYKTIIDEPSTWLTDDSTVDQSIFDNWVISIDGDCANPVEMTLPEMVEQFGTVTQVMKNDCTINGPGQATIMQCEVTGIPVSAIIEYAQPNEGANILSPISSDGYNYAQMSLDWLIENDALIVIEMDGEPLPNSQGYPCQIWVNKTSGGNFVKRISNLTFMTLPEDQLDAQLYVGEFTDNRTGIAYSKPNAGVLNYPSGVVLSGDEAATVHLEGFADAWDEPIAKVEFSLDHGATWTTMETPDNNADYWTYWRLDFTPPQAGSYLLTIRTTSIMDDGSERVCQYDTKFMFTVDAGEAQ